MTARQRGSPIAGEVVRRRLEELLGPDDHAEDAAGPPQGGVSGGLRRAAGQWLRARLSGLTFGRQHVTVVAIIALAGCLWAAFSMAQARTVVLVPASTPAPSSSTPTPTPAPIARIRVHVIGAVKQPGVVQLVEGARVQDAIDAAGGLRPDARPGDLNLAMVVVDGSQIVVGTVAAPGGEVRGAGGGTPVGTTSGGGSASGLVNLNTATVEQLDTLPGVGPVTAAAIVAWRTAHGRFTRVDELGEVDGIGPKTYAQLAPKVTV